MDARFAFGRTRRTGFEEDDFTVVIAVMRNAYWPARTVEDMVRAIT